MFLYIFLIATANGLEMKLNYGKQNQETFAILNLRNTHPFSCEQSFNVNGIAKFILCKIEGIPQSGFNPTKSSMISFSYEMQDISDPDNPNEPPKRYMVIKITPNNNAKLQLFSVFSDLKNEKPIPVTRKSLSKSYQIVAYHNKLPFLNPEENKESRDSINFPVAIPQTSTPTISELDINRKPLHYTAGKDLEAFLEIKQHIRDREYDQALTKISQTLASYPDSLFAKDLLYYAIVALDKSRNEKADNLIIEKATQWAKVYASDDNAPEVMYILGKAHIHENRLKDALYYFNRIAEEYEHSRYAPLAKMQIANTLKSKSDLRRAPLIYREAYQQAKDLESASQIAISWARFNLRNEDFDNADELFRKVYKVFPAYFLIDKQQTQEILNELEEDQRYSIAADIAGYLSGYVPVESEQHANLLMKASEFAMRAGDFDKSHKFNQDFLYYHPNHSLAEAIRARDDSLLFDISGNYSEKMARYEHIIANYPNTENAKKALSLKAQLLLDNKEYANVIAMRNLLPQDSPILQHAIDKQVEIYIRENNCNGIAGVLSNANKVSLTVKESLDVFECLYNQNNYEKANELFSQLHKHIQDGDSQLKWLYLQANTLFALGQDKLAVKAARDVIDLAFAMGKKQYYDIAFKMFNALFNDDSTRAQAIQLSSEIDSWFPQDSRLLPVHFALLNEAQHNNDPLAIKHETNTLMKLQNSLKQYPYSPYINFIYINGLIEDNKYETALQQLESLKQFQLNLDDKQQRFYKIANIYYTLKQMDKSKEALNACIALDSTTTWGTLCNNAMDLHNNNFE
ncbi:hypothetical protein CQA66_02525 [Helicobacter aurati]|uniref:DUF7494 domain-containing protein n=1 Tax=Helicobacter aurati TaxID=137778 RepID=A0A3D8J8L0_9HELI|nr:tetratricopeptide repeat protein [Helicobacter aurati]RDU73191.1 hypothetical protein CQA66_02525 [Helicobacter aurati]